MAGLLVVLLAGCAPQSGRSPEGAANRAGAGMQVDPELARQYRACVEAMRRRDVDGLAALVAPDAQVPELGGRAEAVRWLHIAADAGYFEDLAILADEATLREQDGTAKTGPVGVVGPFGHVRVTGYWARRDGAWQIVRVELDG